MPPDVSWQQDVDLPVGQEVLERNFTDIPRLGLARGAAAPDFVVETLAGGRFQLAEQRGSLVLLDFWASWCAPCRAEFPALRQLVEEHGERLVVVGLNLDPSRSAAERTIRTGQLNWTQARLDGGFADPIATQYGVSALPSTILLDGHGKVLARDLRGPELAAAIAQALSEE